MTDRIDDKAAEALARSCDIYASRTPTHRVATLAYVQSLVAQNACQALVRIMLQKNMVSEADLQRMLAEGYDEAANQVKMMGGLIQPAAPVVRPNKN